VITIQARNVNDALWAGASMIREHGVVGESRNGPVLRAPCPVTTVYQAPMERVMFHPERDANPFFHLVEALWMIAGRNDLKTLTPYVSNMTNFSDDGGKTQPGAYGHRWREHFQLDQLNWAVRRLKADPNDRRVVIQMYDAEVDQYAADNGGKDIPCNLMALPAINVYGSLDLTVFNRSNDMVWGAYGANAVHFSVLQEYLAAQIGVPVGTYFQVSNNFHAYLSTLGKAGMDWPWGKFALGEVAGTFRPDHYGAGRVKPFPMFEPGEDPLYILNDIQMFLDDPARVDIRSPFLRKIACPMVMAHRAYKAGKNTTGIQDALEILEQMPADNDWRAGATLWLKNRAAARSRAADDGVSHDAANQDGASG
jgi:hypothetical protein